MNTPADPQADGGSAYNPPKFRTRRKAPHVTPAEEIPVGELQSHYDRLCRCTGGFPWKRCFLGLAALLAGGVVGSVLAGPGWTDSVKSATVMIILSLLAWRAVSEKETESIEAIRQEFKLNILDSIELVPIEEGEQAAGPAPSPSKEGA